MTGWGTKVKKLYPETITQRAIVKWFRLQYPQLRNHLVMIGNGGKKTVQGHKLAESMGEVVGASDLFLAYPSGEFCGLWVEVKPERYKIVPSNQKHAEKQLKFISEMKEVGYAGGMVIGANAGVEFIKAYMNLEV